MGLCRLRDLAPGQVLPGASTLGITMPKPDLLRRSHS